MIKEWRKWDSGGGCRLLCYGPSGHAVFVSLSYMQVKQLLSFRGCWRQSFVVTKSKRRWHNVTHACTSKHFFITRNGTKEEKQPNKRECKRRRGEGGGHFSGFWVPSHDAATHFQQKASNPFFCCCQGSQPWTC